MVRSSLIGRQSVALSIVLGVAALLTGSLAFVGLPASSAVAQPPAAEGQDPVASVNLAQQVLPASDFTARVDGFIAQYRGRYVDFDGQYGYQCFDGSSDLRGVL